MEHLIFGVDWDNIYYINPDKIVNGNLLWNKKPAWGRGFKFENAPLQLTGGIFRLHCRNGDSFNTIKLTDNVKQINIQQNIGFISCFEKEKLKHFWCIINGLNYTIAQETEEIFSFAVKQTNDATLIFVPKDGRIEILRTPDFAIIDSIAFSESTSQSSIYLTKSGLLLLENQTLYLINRN
jgi:hypothetical protein